MVYYRRRFAPVVPWRGLYTGALDDCIVVVPRDPHVRVSWSKSDRIVGTTYWNKYGLYRPAAAAAVGFQICMYNSDPCLHAKSFSRVSGPTWAVKTSAVHPCVRRVHARTKFSPILHREHHRCKIRYEPCTSSCSIFKHIRPPRRPIHYGLRHRRHSYNHGWLYEGIFPQTPPTIPTVA